VELLGALEQSALARALKTSFYVYPLVNALHILALGAVVTLAGLIDLRVLGVVSRAALPSTGLLRRMALAAFAVAAASGLALFSVRAVDYAANGAFRLKLVLIALAGLNFLVFLALSRGRDDPAAGSRLLALASLVLWIAILVSGRFIAFA